MLCRLFGKLRITFFQSDGGARRGGRQTSWLLAWIHCNFRRRRSVGVRTYSPLLCSLSHSVSDTSPPSRTHRSIPRREKSFIGLSSLERRIAGSRAVDGGRRAGRRAVAVCPRARTHFGEEYGRGRGIARMRRSAQTDGERADPRCN